MKPRTKYQREVVAKGLNLNPSPPKRIFEWAKRTVINHYAYRLKSGKTTCLDCGHEFVSDKLQGEVHCPHCHAKLTAQTTTKSTYRDRAYFSYLTTVKGLQLIRSFRLDAFFSKQQSVRYDLHEICRHFINSDGKVEVIALPKTLGHYMDCFAVYSGDMDLRSENGVYRYVASCWIAPHKRIAPFLRKRGFSGALDGCNVIDLMQAVLANPKYETLIKNGDTNAVAYFLSRGYRGIENYWAEYKIARRNHCQLSDIGLWCDTIDALRFLDRDTHNPHYICPDNLQLAHDYWTGKVQQERKRREREQQRKEAAAAQKHFEEVKSRFFGLVIADKQITISVINRVDDFYQLGDDMHICLGSMKYFKKDSSLILLAKVNGIIKEVIELSLDTLQVIQSRSYCNKPSEYHEQIVSLMEQNIQAVAKLKAA